MPTRVCVARGRPGPSQGHLPSESLSWSIPSGGLHAKLLGQNLPRVIVTMAVPVCWQHGVWGGSCMCVQCSCLCLLACTPAPEPRPQARFSVWIAFDSAGYDDARGKRTHTLDYQRSGRTRTLIAAGQAAASCQRARPKRRRRRTAVASLRLRGQSQRPG